MSKKILIFLFIFTFFLKTPLLSDEKRIMVIAHRGASGYAPENTVSAFKKAIMMKADMIEFDVHLTKDGKVVLMHDKTVDRTTDGKGKVKEMTLKELKKLDAGLWFDKKFKGEKIPTLEKVLKKFKGKILFNIEIKSEGTEEEIVRLIKKYKLEKDVMVSSFNHQFLKKIKT
jgi:glycerophosphoryl diester phosphodiesterase